MSQPDASPPYRFGPADRQLLSAIRRHDQGLRALLCTLARYGVRLRVQEPARASAWLDELAGHPVFKGGQFLFDLLEWEDFMLDGEPPAPLDTAELQQAWARLAGLLRNLGAGLDMMALDPAPPAAAMSAADLPALESGFYLYQDVLLGGLALLSASDPTPQG